VKKLLSITLVLCALMANGLAQKSDRDATLRSLLEAERGFAKASIDKGTRAAFIENLADDSTVFHPGPVNGKKWWTERPIRPGVLSWQPVFADVSNAGEMGYTTGPWEFREKSLTDKPIAFGQFVTVWKVQADGTWKAAVDLGISNPQPQTPAPQVAFPANNKKPKSKMEAEPSELLKTEIDFSKHVAEKKTVDAFLSYLAEDVRLFREGSFPAIGREATRALLATKTGLLTWQATKAEVSRSGDLGYSYGSYELKASDGKAENGNYLRIWKRQGNGKWKVVLDLLNLIPPPSKN
jgi:ketosteroid isomerase-like protein